MIRKLHQKNTLLYCGLSVVFVLVVLILGHSIISEGVKLLFAQRITAVSQNVNQGDGYSLIASHQAEETGINFIITGNDTKTKLKGVLAQIENQYILVFTQQALKANTHFILTQANFEQASLILFRNAVVNQVAVEKGLSIEEVDRMIHAQVFYDHTQRMLNDIPVVLLWLTILSFGMINAVAVGMTHLKIASKLKLSHGLIWGRDRNSFILSTGVIRLGHFPVYMGYDEVLIYEEIAKGLSLKTKDHVFTIQCSEHLRAAIKQRIIPDFVIKNKASTS